MGEKAGEHKADARKAGARECGARRVRQANRLPSLEELTGIAGSSDYRPKKLVSSGPQRSKPRQSNENRFWPTQIVPDFDSDVESALDGISPLPKKEAISGKKQDRYKVSKGEAE